MKSSSRNLREMKTSSRNLREIFPKSSFQNLREIVILERWKQVPQILERWKQIPEILENYLYHLVLIKSMLVFTKYCKTFNYFCRTPDLLESLSNSTSVVSNLNLKLSQDFILEYFVKNRFMKTAYSFNSNSISLWVVKTTISCYLGIQNKSLVLR